MDDENTRRAVRRGRYRKYTARQRRQAVRDADEIGVKAAAVKHSVPTSTLNGWRRSVWSTTEDKVPEDHCSNGAKQATGKEESATTPVQDGEGPQSLVGGQDAVAAPGQGNGASAPVQHDPGASQGVSQRGGNTKVAKTYTPSQRAQILEVAAERGVTVAHREFNVSRFSIYQWQRQLDLAAQGKGDAPTSGPDPKEVEALRDKEILDEWRRHPGLGPSQIRNQLRRKNVKVSVQTTRRVMQEAGYRPPKVKRQEHDERFEAARPNHIWHLDYVHRWINRTNVHTLILIDDHSRFVVGHGTDDAERSDFVIATFEQAVERHGKPECVLHDRGSAFWSWRGISRFTALLVELGVDQIA
ncbi:MAG: DDE-type integrase/transposase/recombinase, partial [Gemmatimonadales bacterium]